MIKTKKINFERFDLTVKLVETSKSTEKLTLL